MLPTNPLLNATAPAGPHLPVALLRQYAAGTLAPAAQHRVEAHTLACPRCADVLAGLRQTPAATTDRALAQLQQRLRQRTAQQAAPARQVRVPQQHRWLVLQLATAAALLLGLVAGGWWAWQQRRATSLAAAATTSPIPAAASATTLPPPELATPMAPAAAAAQSSAALATRQRRHQHPHTLAGRHPQRPLSAAAPPATALGEAALPNDVAPAPLLAAPVAATASQALPPPDSVALPLRGRTVAAAGFAAAPALVRATPMPAAQALPPAPVGGYSALREKLRREATEFKPEAPEQPLSGTVQLRLTIGADGKLQQTKVLRGLREDYDAEAQRLVCDGPGWIPGISGGRRAPLEIDIAVPF